MLKEQSAGSSWLARHLPYQSGGLPAAFPDSGLSPQIRCPYLAALPTSPRKGPSSSAHYV